MRDPAPIARASGRTAPGVGLWHAACDAAPPMRRAALFVALLASAHCGARSELLPASGTPEGDDGGAALAGDGASGAGPIAFCDDMSSADPPIIAIAVAHEVQLCDWDGRCGVYASVPGCAAPARFVGCDCVGGRVSCPSLVAECSGGPCPDPSRVWENGSCTWTESGPCPSCPSTTPVYDCVHRITGYVECTCNGGGWDCRTPARPLCRDE
jgi:hypothetical protein